MLRQCCCGCTLKTGTIILGVLDAIAAAYYLISSIVVASAAIAVDDKNKTYLETAATLATVLAVFSAVLLLVAICLIVGAANSKPNLLIPWMGYTIVFIVENTVVNIYYAVQYFELAEGAFGAGMIVGAVIYLLLQLYFLLVVYSLFRELRGTSPLPGP